MAGKARLSDVAILSIRGTESLVAVAVATGLNVFQVFVHDPFTFLETIYQYVLNAGNIFYVAIGIVILYATGIDKDILVYIRRIM